MLIHPGHISPLLNLEAVLRERHEDLQADRAREIAKRTAKGIPLDDETDWTKLSTERLAAGIAARDTDVVVDEAQRIVIAAAGHKLEPIADFEPIPHYQKFLLRFRALKDSKRRELLAPIAERETRDEGIRAFVVAAVDVVVDDGEEHRDIGGILDALEATGMLVDVFVAARDYQRLSQGKDGRFGLPAQST